MAKAARGRFFPVHQPSQRTLSRLLCWTIYIYIYIYVCNILLRYIRIHIILLHTFAFSLSLCFDFSVLKSECYDWKILSNSILPQNHVAFVK